MLKKVMIFFGETNSEVVIFLGIKYEPLLGPHPPQFVSGAPGGWGGRAACQREGINRGGG